MHVGDALAADVRIEEGFSGLIVDLFTEDGLPEALQQVTSWSAAVMLLIEIDRLSASQTASKWAQMY